MSRDDEPSEADHLYRPLGGLGAWATIEVDRAAWDRVLAVGHQLRAAATGRAALLRRGAHLAAAYQSGALAGRYHDRPEAAAALLNSGSLAALRAGPEASAVVPHVAANHAALEAAAAAEPTTLASDAFIRATHVLACAPQTHHHVHGGGHGTGDHVLGPGDYKHHANHRPTGGGGWRAHAPVAVVPAEMARLVAALAGGDLHPVAGAAYALHALHHVAPFAAGNGRVGRALAGGILVHAGGVPLLMAAPDRPCYQDALEGAAAGQPAALVDLVQGCLAALGRQLGDLLDGPALDGEAQWQRQSAAATAVAGLLPDRLAAALARHRDRRAAGWEADLSSAQVVGDGPTVLVRCATDGPAPIVEVVRVDPHPVRVGADGPVLVAELAGLELDLTDHGAMAAGSFAGRLDRWLDLAVAGLAVRVAAEAE